MENSEKEDEVFFLNFSFLKINLSISNLKPRLK